jgi:methionyl-tRNA synthetase
LCPETLTKLKEYKRHLITAALPYANGPLHIGHIAGAYLTADIYSRHLRSQGKDVVFVCGSDEHGAAITLRAKKENTTPQEIVDKYHGIIKKAFVDFDISFDVYDRTSSENHKKTSQDFFTNLYDKNAFEKKTSSQYYDEEHNQFLADRYIQGTCPNCDYDQAYGDQCERCGKTLSPEELINPQSTLSGNAPVKKETTHWYLPMNHHEGWIKTWVEEGTLEGAFHHDPKTWKRHVVGQCGSWINSGLHPRSMTRDLDWGVPVPLAEANGKVLYVWMDAPIGYISATKKWAKENNKDWEKYWKDPETKLTHFIGKDNIVFHCIIFPILLKIHGDFILPENVPANEFLNLEGDKISTSRDHAVWLHEYLEEMPDRVDELRYVLASIIPETKDSEFTWKDYQARVNNELVAILGNFVNRAVVLTHKYFDGKVPPLQEGYNPGQEVNELFANNASEISDLIHQYKFREALQKAMQAARVGNKYLADTEPWKLVKEDKETVASILHIALKICAYMTSSIETFLPNSSNKLKGILNLSDEGNIFVSGHQINPASLLFKKVEDEEIEKQIEKLKAKKQENKKPVPVVKKAEVKGEISFDDFMKMDLRVGEIVEAIKVPKADKLLQLSVSFGDETRTIVSGIAEHYSSDEVIGKKVSVLMNLAPRKIRGVESQGMILMAEDSSGKLNFVSPDSGFEVGSVIR